MTNSDTDKPWTQDHTDFVLRGRRSGVPFAEIARIMCRPVDEVRARHAALHMVADFAAFWTPSRVAQLGRLRAAHWPAIAIAEKLQCDEAAVAWAIPRFKRAWEMDHAEAGRRVCEEPSPDQFTTEQYRRFDRAFRDHIIALVDAGEVPATVYAPRKGCGVK